MSFILMLFCCESETTVCTYNMTSYYTVTFFLFLFNAVFYTFKPYCQSVLFCSRELMLKVLRLSYS